MEDGAKEDPVQWKETKFLGKAGWVKKAPGRLLASYKDRYIHVEKTEVVVYENEDLQNCLERLDLENYDKCHELRSPFKKKHRLILIRSPKSGNKVNDVKFQAQTPEEKEAWIKALSDGINRAKNKVFDEVKIDESCNLEHVTRTRPKGNRNRRPPTRIHMKEVAIMSSDGILRLDLDNALIFNGTHDASVDGTETPKGAIYVPTTPSIASEATQKQSGQSAEEEAQNEPEVSPQKKDIKPPMPPTKEAKYSVTPEDEPDKDDGLMKVPKLPIPPSKESKPCVSSAEETTENNKGRKMPEKSPDSRKKTGPPPPTPPNKPSSISNLVDVSQSRPNSHPPMPPSNEKKPSHSTIDPDQEVQGTNDEIKEAQPSVTFDKPESPSTEGQISEEESGETRSNDLNKVSHTETKQDPTALLETASYSLTSFPQAQKVLSKSVPSVLVSLNDPYPDKLSQSPVLCLLHGEEKKEEEESLDSSQHSDDDSEDSLAAPTAAWRENHAVLDKVDASVDDIQISVHLRQPQTSLRSQVRSEGFPSQCSKPNSPLKTSAKARSASIGDLLYDSSVCTQVTQHTRSATGNDRVPSDDFTTLEAKVSLEMEKTSELLSKVSQYEKGHDEEGTPEILLAKAMEKLKKAEHVLREVKKLKPAKNSSNRKSW